MASLDALQTSINDLEEVLTDLQKVLPAPLVPSASALQQEIDAFRPRIAVVGQVKAGKTALVNALLGMPDFLPSDVNPWTSVVTSIHLNTPPQDGNHAVFKFFDEDAWTRIAEHGGRLGELAARTDSASEADELRAQVDDLQRRTAARLGPNYRLLLGGCHRFSEVKPGLVQRYVCLGDGTEGEDDRQGRFADMTRSADLYLAAPEYSMPLTIDDTPGVNDPFLLREQMTLDALDQASICVLVLSAYQAMTTVDLGLVRLLRTLEAEQVIIFVNRIDELPNRHDDIPKIEKMIRAILSRQGAVQDATIIFGSAEWARKAARGSIEELTEDDLEALAGPLRETVPAGDTPDRRAVLDALRTLSGLNDLKGEIATRTAMGPGARSVAAFRRQIGGLVAQAKVHLQAAGNAPSNCDEFAIAEELDYIANAAEEDLSIAMRSAIGAVESLHASLVSRWVERTTPDAVRAEGGIMDPSELRSELVAAYDEIAAEARDRIDAVMQDAETALRMLYAHLLPAGADAFPIYRCVAPDFPRPTALARSTTFDLRGGWADVLRSPRLRAERRAERFRDIAEREFRDILSEVGQRAIGEGFAMSRRTLHGFLMPHDVNIQALAATDSAGERRKALLGEHSQRLMKRLGTLSARVDSIGTERPSVRAASDGLS